MKLPIVQVLVITGVVSLAGMSIGNRLAAEHTPEQIRLERKVSFSTLLKVNNPDPSVSPSMAQEKSWGEFKEIATAVARREDYPANVLLAQAALESAHGTSHFAKVRHNYFGMCAYTSDPNKACSYLTIEEGVMAYIKLIKTTPRYQGAWSQKNNPKAMIAAIKAAGYATDPLYVEKVTGTPEFRGL